MGIASQLKTTGAQITTAASTNLSAAHNLRFTFVYRDKVQSQAGNKIPLDVEEFLESYKHIKAFNDAGPIKIVAIEGPSGAAPQVEALSGRCSLESLENIDKVLDPSIAIRLLVRGPFGVAVDDPYSVEDLEWLYAAMAKAAGAVHPPYGHGRQVIFKLFEAQNRPIEHVESLIALSRLRKTGGYNIGCELAVSYSPDGKFDRTYYEAIAQAIVDQTVDPELIVGFSIKDMAGVLRSSDELGDHHMSAAALTDLLISLAKRKAEETGNEHYVALHSHAAGHSDKANAETAAHALAQNMPVQIDVMAGDHPGFSTITDVLQLINESPLLTGQVELTARQSEILDEISGYINQADAAYNQYFKVNVRDLWSDAQLKRAGTPLGAVPSNYTGMVKPKAETFARAFFEDPNPTQEQIQKLEKIIADTFVPISALLGDGIQQVTPGAKYIGFNLAGEMIQHMLFRPANGQSFIDKVLAAGFDMSEEWPQEWRDQVASYIDRLGPSKQLEYFRYQMPVEINPKLARRAAQVNFERLFPEKAEDRKVLLKLVIQQDEYAELRQKLAAHLDDKDGGKAFAKTELHAFVERHAANSPNMYGSVTIDNTTASIDELVDQHIGKNIFSIGKGVDSRLSAAKAYVADLKEKGYLAVPEHYAIFNILALQGNRIAEQAIQYCRYPASICPHLWGVSPTTIKMTPLEKNFNQIMADADKRVKEKTKGAYRVIKFMDLMKYDPDQALSIFADYVAAAKKGQPLSRIANLFGIQDYMAQVASHNQSKKFQHRGGMGDPRLGQSWPAFARQCGEELAKVAASAMAAGSPLAHQSNRLARVTPV